MVERVSIHLQTYNHTTTIRQCLESVTGQVTQYDFDVYVADDHSVDGTWEIILDFLRSYDGDNVSAFRNAKNLGGRPNLVRGLQRLRGEFFCVIDGDDFWDSKTKLEAQVNFLVEHPDFQGVGHPTHVLAISPDGAECFQDDLTVEHENIEAGLTHQDFLTQEYYLHTSALMFRNIHLTEGVPRKYKNPTAGDLARLVYHARFGPIGYLPGHYSTYRRHLEGRWTKLPQIKRRYLNLLQWYYIHEDAGFPDAFEFSRLWWACNELRELISKDPKPYLRYRFILWLFLPIFDVHANRYEPDSSSRVSIWADSAEKRARSDDERRRVRSFESTLNSKIRAYYRIRQRMFFAMVRLLMRLRLIGVKE